MGRIDEISIVLGLDPPNLFEEWFVWIYDLLDLVLKRSDDHAISHI